MSAIFGIIDFEGRPIDPEWIKSMQKDLAHRGPDGQGLYQEESMFMGHMLLQVTPESVYDKSPYEEDGLVITAHARLDEREAIMDRLGIPESERKTIVDALLLLRSFKKFGKDFVKDIYGDFAFAIWDKEKKELFCARDQIGVKPFLYYHKDGRFTFSTEIKALVNLPFINTEINHQLLIENVLGIFGDPILTSWTEIFRLKAATYLNIFSKKRLVFKTYWNPVYKRNKNLKSEKDSADNLRYILQRVIEDHTRTIHKIGIPLSGGLDSGTIACLTAKRFKNENQKITTVSSVLHPSFKDDNTEDEMEYIKAILNQEKNLNPEFIHHSDLSFTKNLDKKFEKHYQPLVPSHYVDEAINEVLSKNNIRRVLSGFLGDMTTSNSTIYPIPHLFRSFRFKKATLLIKRRIKEDNIPLKSLILSEVILPSIPLEIHDLWFKVRKKKAPWDIIDLDFDWTNEFKRKLNHKLKFTQMKYLNHQSKIGRNIRNSDVEIFGEEWDCGPSHHNLEYSYPLLDRRVIEFLLEVPIEHFNSEGKKRGLIRKSMNGILPEIIKDRTKKMAYSPGYFQINKRDVFERPISEKYYSIPVFKDFKFNFNRHNFKIKHCAENEKNDIFVNECWSMTILRMWILFEIWNYSQNDN